MAEEYAGEVRVTMDFPTIVDAYKWLVNAQAMGALAEDTELESVDLVNDAVATYQIVRVR